MRYRLLIGFVLAAALGASACQGPPPAKAANSPESKKLIVGVSVAHRRDLIRTAQTQGALFPRESTVLAAEVPGTISQVVADFGDNVKAGQVLLRIDQREYALRVDSAEAQYDQVEARLANARANFERVQQLNQAHLISGQQFDQASAELRVAEADTEAASKQVGLMRKKLADTYVRAPFAGSVQKRMTSLGAHVAEGTPLYELIAIDPIKLRAPIPERFVPMVKPGLKIQLSVDARPNQLYDGIITRIAPGLDENSRTLLVEAEVPNPSGELKPGYFAHVTMNLGHDSAVFVPMSAILRYAGVARVFVFSAGVVKSREVVTGVTEGDQIEIISGLREGEKIVVTDVDRLADGTAVVAKEQS